MCRGNVMHYFSEQQNNVDTKKKMRYFLKISRDFLDHLSFFKAGNLFQVYRLVFRLITQCHFCIVKAALWFFFLGV